MPTRDGELRGPDGRTLAIYEGGKLSGAPVFYLHGSPSSGLLYARHVELAESRGIRLIGYDRPGYGGSTAHTGRTVGDGARDVGAIADELGLERFALWGISGGGPHALGCAALLGGRLAAVASLASVAPWGAEGLDWLGGMGEANVEEFTAALEGRDALEPLLREEARTLTTIEPDQLVAAWSTLLTPADTAVLNGELAGWVLAAERLALRHGIEGWLDDDLAFAAPWGFELDSIDVPVQLWQGREDAFVPPHHGEWLAARIPGVEAHITPDDGHLTLLETRLPAVLDWLAGWL